MSLEKVGVFVLGAVAVAGGAIVAASLLAPPPTASASSDSKFDASSWGELVGSTTQKGAPWPAEYTLPENFISSSAVLLTSSDGIDYWTVGNTNGDLCLGFTLDGPNRIASFGCAGEAEFSQHGIAVQAHTVDGSVRAYLVPDAVNSRVALEGFEYLTDNLIVTSPFNAVDQEVPLTAAPEGRSSGTVTLRPFGAPDDFTKAPEVASDGN